MRTQKKHAGRRPTKAFGIAAFTSALVVFVGFVSLQAPPSDAAAIGEYGIWSESERPASSSDVDKRPVELGLQFTSRVDGWVTAIQYYKVAGAPTSDNATLWNASGSILARTNFAPRSAEGWTTAHLKDPIEITAGQKYVASYTATGGTYFADQFSLGGRYQQTTRDLTALAGVYSYELDFPDNSWNSSNYFVDIVFTPTDPDGAGAPQTTTTRSTPSSTTAATSSAPASTPAPTTRTTTAPPTQTGGFPGAANTGYDNAPGYPGQLTTCSLPIKSNTTYKFCNFAGGAGVGSANSPVSNVSFYACRFASNATDDANVALYGDNVSFDYSSFEPSADSAPPTNYGSGYQYGIDIRQAGKVTIDHSDFWGWGNGIQFGSSSQSKPLIVRNSWFHDARSDGGGIDHTDAILSNDGGPSYMQFEHNTIASVGNTQGLALQTESRPYDHVKILNNYFSGFGYTVAIGESIPSTNIEFTGNVFGTDFKPVWGPLYTSTRWNSSAGNVWRDNTWNVVPGSYYSPTSDDGKFWLPSGAKSTTDYTG